MVHAKSTNKYKQFRLLGDLFWRNKKRNVKIIKQLTVCNIIFILLLQKRKIKKTLKLLLQLLSLLSLHKKKQSKRLKRKIKLFFFFKLFLISKTRTKIKKLTLFFHKIKQLKLYYRYNLHPFSTVTKDKYFYNMFNKRFVKHISTCYFTLQLRIVQHIWLYKKLISFFKIHFFFKKRKALLIKKKKKRAKYYFMLRLRYHPKVLKSNKAAKEAHKRHALKSKKKKKILRQLKNTSTVFNGVDAIGSHYWDEVIPDKKNKITFSNYLKRIYNFKKKNNALLFPIAGKADQTNNIRISNHQRNKQLFNVKKKMRKNSRTRWRNLKKLRFLKYKFMGFTYEKLRWFVFELVVYGQYYLLKKKRIWQYLRRRKMTFNKKKLYNNILFILCPQKTVRLKLKESLYLRKLKQRKLFKYLFGIDNNTYYYQYIHFVQNALNNCLYVLFSYQKNTMRTLFTTINSSKESAHSIFLIRKQNISPIFAQNIGILRHNIMMDVMPQDTYINVFKKKRIWLTHNHVSMFNKKTFFYYANLKKMFFLTIVDSIGIDSANVPNVTLENTSFFRKDVSKNKKVLTLLLRLSKIFRRKKKRSYKKRKVKKMLRFKRWRRRQLRKRQIKVYKTRQHQLNTHTQTRPSQRNSYKSTYNKIHNKYPIKQYHKRHNKSFYNSFTGKAYSHTSNTKVSPHSNKVHKKGHPHAYYNANTTKYTKRKRRRFFMKRKIKVKLRKSLMNVFCTTYICKQLLRFKYVTYLLKKKKMLKLTRRRDRKKKTFFKRFFFKRKKYKNNRKIFSIVPTNMLNAKTKDSVQIQAYLTSLYSYFLLIKNKNIGKLGKLVSVHYPLFSQGNISLLNTIQPEDILEQAFENNKKKHYSFLNNRTNNLKKKTSKRKHLLSYFIPLDSFVAEEETWLTSDLLQWQFFLKKKNKIKKEFILLNNNINSFFILLNVKEQVYALTLSTDIMGTFLKPFSRYKYQSKLKALKAKYR